MAQTRLRLSNPALRNTLGLAVRLRVHSHWWRFLSSPQQSAHTVPVSPTSRQHPQQQQQRNDPLCSTDRRASFREGPARHDQASLCTEGALELWTSPPSAFGEGRVGTGGAEGLVYKFKIGGGGWWDEKEHSLQPNVFTFLYLLGMKSEWMSRQAPADSLL